MWKGYKNEWACFTVYFYKRPLNVPVLPDGLANFATATAYALWRRWLEAFWNEDHALPWGKYRCERIERVVNG